MAVLDQAVANLVPQAAAKNGFMQSNNSAKPKAELWMNIGYEHGGRFVNLPFGQPIDTMSEAKIGGQNAEWNAFQTARNQLLEGLKGLGFQLEPGQEITIPNLVIKLRRTEKPAVAETNDYSVDVMALLTGKTVATQAAE